MVLENLNVLEVVRCHGCGPWCAHTLARQTLPAPFMRPLQRKQRALLVTLPPPARSTEALQAASRQRQPTHSHRSPAATPPNALRRTQYCTSGRRGGRRQPPTQCYRACVCVCACVYVRVCVRACVCVCGRESVRRRDSRDRQTHTQHDRTLQIETPAATPLIATTSLLPGACGRQRLPGMRGT
jgi:hypothetical protein